MSSSAPREVGVGVAGVAMANHDLEHEEARRDIAGLLGLAAGSGKFDERDALEVLVVADVMDKNALHRM